MNMPLHREYRAYIDRIRSQATNSFELGQVAKWIERNTTDPVDPARLWSFKDHEYQVEIISDMSDEVVVRKCSQVGASEMWVRLVLGILALAKRITIIYVLPTKGFASKFSKGRIDPVVAESQVLSAMLNPDVDSSELKQFGRSFLYIAGSYGQNAAISVPAQGLFQDEVDFCDQTTLTTFNSRLGHSKPGEYYKRSFSTPTVDKFGIDKMFGDSSQAHYLVRHDACGEWVALNLLSDVEIPGFNGNLTLFEKDDLYADSVSVDDAFVRCSSCRAPISQENLCNPTKRQWVHLHPGRSVRGYQILPTDVPVVNPIARTIRTIADYDRKKDWVNFKLGYPYSDAETSFLADMIDRYAVHSVLPRPGDDDVDMRLASRTAFGLDVGKISWFTVMAPVNGEARVVYAERIRQDGDNYLGKRVLHLVKVFGCVKGVVDAGPDISVSKFLVDKRPEGHVWACYYVRQQKATLENFNFKEEEGILNASRTGTLDNLAKRINSGKTTLCKGPELHLMKEHLGNLKRVDNRNDQGELLSSWVVTGDDHYGHSLNYCQIAFDMMVGGMGISQAIPCTPMMGKVALSTESSTSIEEFDPLGLKLDARFRP